MNIIQKLQLDKKYLNNCYKTLSTTFEVIDIDCGKGETDTICLIYFPKKKYTFYQAMSMLTLKQKMLNEEWNNLELYNSADIDLWTKMLVEEYASSEIIENINEQEFLNDDLVKRLKKEDKNHTFFHNKEQISFLKLQKINPCKNIIITISKSKYNRLEAEYYIETEQHFILFNWHTTA